MHRLADVTGLGAGEPRVEGLALPISVESGKLNVNSASIRWMSDKLASPNILERFSCLSGNAAWLGPEGTTEFFDRRPFPNHQARAYRAGAPVARTCRALHPRRKLIPAVKGFH
jgi:hypothetical protein